jgi:hypothetical protein
MLSPVEDAISPEALHLEQILSSRTFGKSETLRTLFRYLWEHRNDKLSEYAIAIDALGRKHDFDSKIDATVRVQILRLRQRLAAYYEAEGQSAGLKFVIPLGTHQVQLISPAAETASSPIVPAIETDVLVPAWREHERPAPLPSWVKAMLLGLATVYLGWATGFAGQPDPPRKPPKQPPAFWKQFLDNGKPTVIVLPVPVFFTWITSKSTLMARDIQVNEFSRSSDSEEIVNLEKRLGKPALAQNYTVTSDTFASLRMVRFFDANGVQTLISAATASPDEMLDSENLIALGTSTSLAPFRAYLDELSFSLGGDQTVFDKTRKPAGIAFKAVHESPARAIYPGIIALLPGKSSDGRILILQSLQTTGLVSYLTSEEGLKELDKARAEAGQAAFFEAVVLSEMEGTVPLKSRLAAFRPYRPA